MNKKRSRIGRRLGWIGAEQNRWRKRFNSKRQDVDITVINTYSFIYLHLHSPWPTLFSYSSALTPTRNIPAAPTISNTTLHPPPSASVQQWDLHQKINIERRVFISLLLLSTQIQQRQQKRIRFWLVRVTSLVPQPPTRAADVTIDRCWRSWGASRFKTKQPKIWPYNSSSWGGKAIGRIVQLRVARIMTPHANASPRRLWCQTVTFVPITECGVK